VLVELSKMEQRYDAVLAVVRDGLSIGEVAAAFGVSRQSIYRWMQRYEMGGLPALAEHSHRPRSCPHQLAPTLEATVLEMRRVHPSWGPLRLLDQLRRREYRNLPSHMATYRALVRHGLIEAKEQRKHLVTYKRWERGRPMELWQMNVVGGILLDDSTECKILTGIDDHSSRHWSCLTIPAGQRIISVQCRHRDQATDRAASMGGKSRRASLGSGCRSPASCGCESSVLAGPAGCRPPG
jgi:transposase